MQPIENVMLRIEAEHLLRARSPREHFEYVKSRGSSSLERRELRTSVPTREISLSVEWVFWLTACRGALSV